MRRFNYKEVFKKFFPFYYQEYDSYKNAEGEGLLERLITTCTEYFDTDVMANPHNPGLDNMINLIDIDTTPEIFLNYLWEYLGEIPYAWGVLTNGKPYTQENLAEWLTASKRGYPRADARRVLKYAISLYKIRGTNAFYHILGRIYGVQIELLEHGTGTSILDTDYIKALYVSSEDTTEEVGSFYTGDQEVSSQYSRFEYRGAADCLKCVELTVNIKIPTGVYEVLETSPYITLEGVKQAFIKVMEKYLPVFCKLYVLEDGTVDLNLINYSPALLVR